MKNFTLLLLVFLPFAAFGQFPEFKEKYPETDWSKLSTWPKKIEHNGNHHVRVISQNIGDISFPAIKGRNPTIKESKRLGANAHGAYFEPKINNGLHEFGNYGPIYRWDGQGNVSEVSFSDGKGTIKSYDKKGKVFMIETRDKDGLISYFYIDKYGRKALEFRLRKLNEEYFQYRKPCSKWQFEEMKKQVLENFDLYKPIEEYRP